jgi:DNA-binding NarL/FixJ family response regulator
MPPVKARIRTLVFDDSADFMRYLCVFLEALPNVEVIAQGRDGREAIVLAHEWVPDLILMDVTMPEMTGLEAASQLVKEMPDVLVILMLVIVKSFCLPGTAHTPHRSCAMGICSPGQAPS